MALSANQKKRGTQHEKSSPDDVARTGRDSAVRTPAKGFTEKGKSPVEGVARTGRGDSLDQVGPSKGIGRGNADAGGGDASRMPADGVGKPLPSA
jgi:hypothetical protein